jgi:hypothetical protein
MFKKLIAIIIFSVLFLSFTAQAPIFAEEDAEAVVSADDEAAIQQLISAFFTIIKQAYETKSDADIDALLGLAAKDSEYAIDAENFRSMMKDEINNTVSLALDDLKIGRIQVSDEKGFVEFSYLVTKSRPDNSRIRKIQSGGFQLKKEDGAWKIFAMGREDNVLEGADTAQPEEPAQAAEAQEPSDPGSEGSSIEEY